MCKGPEARKFQGCLGKGKGTSKTGELRKCKITEDLVDYDTKLWFYS